MGETKGSVVILCKAVCDLLKKKLLKHYYNLNKQCLCAIS